MLLLHASATMVVVPSPLSHWSARLPLAVVLRNSCTRVSCAALVGVGDRETVAGWALGLVFLISRYASPTALRMICAKLLTAPVFCK